MVAHTNTHCIPAHSQQFTCSFSVLWANIYGSCCLCCSLTPRDTAGSILPFTVFAYQMWYDSSEIMCQIKTRLSYIWHDQLGQRSVTHTTEIVFRFFCKRNKNSQSFCSQSAHSLEKTLGHFDMILKWHDLRCCCCFHHCFLHHKHFNINKDGFLQISTFAFCLIKVPTLLETL